MPGSCPPRRLWRSSPGIGSAHVEDAARSKKGAALKSFMIEPGGRLGREVEVNAGQRLSTGVIIDSRLAVEGLAAYKES